MPPAGQIGLGSRPSWHFDPALPNHSSGIRIVATPDTVRSLPSSLPQLADFEVWVTGSAATRFPTLIGGNVPILNGPDSLFTVAAGRVFPYGADSGTVHVTPVGGNAVHVNFDVWFGSGEGLPEFRLVGSLVAAPQL